LRARNGSVAAMQRRRGIHGYRCLRISAEMAIRVAAVFGSSPEVWLGLQLECDLAQATTRASRIKVARIAARSTAHTNPGG
jgi:plasmid maintenance system antidote protein VapI